MSILFVHLFSLHYSDEPTIYTWLESISLYYCDLFYIASWQLLNIWHMHLLCMVSLVAISVWITACSGCCWKLFSSSAFSAIRCMARMPSLTLNKSNEVGYLLIFISPKCIDIVSRLIRFRYRDTPVSFILWCHPRCFSHTQCLWNISTTHRTRSRELKPFTKASFMEDMLTRCSNYYLAILVFHHTYLVAWIQHCMMRYMSLKKFITDFKGSINLRNNLFDRSQVTHATKPHGAFQRIRKALD